MRDFSSCSCAPALVETPGMRPRLAFGSSGASPWELWEEPWGLWGSGVSWGFNAPDAVADMQKFPLSLKLSTCVAEGMNH